MLYKAYRYSQWDGTQELFDMDADEVLDQLSNELFQHGDMWRALRDMMRQGMQDRSGQQMPGMQRLMEQLRNQRRDQLQQYNMDSVMDDLKEKLKEIIQTERAGIDKRLDQAREQTEAWQQIEADGGAEREQYESLYKMLEQRAQSNTEKPRRPPRQRRGPDSGTHGVRLHGPRCPSRCSKSYWTCCGSRWRRTWASR